MLFYEQFVQFEKTSGQQLYGYCPMHFDTNASFTVNLETNEWFCHGCNAGGKEPEFIAKYFDVSRDTAIKAFKQWSSHQTLMFPSEDYVDECIQRLLSKPAELKFLEEFGITETIIKQRKLGWDDTRITIPVYSKTDKLINIRKYLPPHRRIEGSNNAKIIGIRGCNEARFYPLDNLTVDKKDIWIVEGEKDCLVAISQGFNAVTGTGGSAMPTMDLKLFQDKHVHLMGDSDTAGVRLTKHYIKQLTGIANKISVITLPCKDFTEFWSQYHTTDVEQYTREVEDIQEITEHPENAVTLSKSEYVENLNTWVTLKNMCVTGVDPKIYTIPDRIKVKCGNMQCNKPCKVGLAREPIEAGITPRQLLQFLNSSDLVQDNYAKKLFGCKSIVAEPASYVNVQKIVFQETASFVDGMEEATFEPRYGIFIYDDTRLTPTVKYDFVSCRVTDPKTQQTYYVIKEATPVQQYTEAFNENNVKYFQDIAQKCESCEQLLNTHYDMWKFVLGIEKRMDLFGALMLSYMSVTEITWKTGTLKGWLDTMIIGDTRTGKSQMAQRIVKNLQMGSYINGENARRTGVIGGVQRFADSWIITWGAIPLNDKGLLIIDEASGLEIEDIKELSATRSSGAVAINKIAKGEARARTRLIWLSNPRSGKNIEDFYWKGYGAFMEFIPVVEDQARYDLVISAARGDITLLEGIKEGKIDIQKYRELIGFAWSLSKDNIIIDDDSQKEIEKTVKDLSKEYEGGPLFVGVAAHEKLLRLSCAFAVLCGSIEDGCLYIKSQHIKYAKEFISMTFDKDTLDYKGFIEESRKAIRAKDANMKFIRAQIVQYPALRVLLSANRFRGNQISEILGVDRTEASKLISELLQRGLMKISYNGSYQPDKLLVDIARQMNV